MQTITVGWRHQVHFARGVFAPQNLLLREVLTENPSDRPARVLAVLDQSLVSAQPELPGKIQQYFSTHQKTLELAGAPMVVEGGEQTKNGWQHVSEIHAQIDRHHLDRQNYVICVGGGALLDMAGFAAATAHRGIRFVRLPTTTLSQADSGVGVKNGINAFGKKNFIGTFAPPYAVINDFDLLASLTLRDKRAGYVEAVKVSCIKDREFFEEIEGAADALARFEPDAMQRLIRRCAEVHIEHIVAGGDPFEFGAARPLDFGHWSAHQLEQLSNFRLRHGEAVAIGIGLDVLYARAAGLLDAASAGRILVLLERLGFELFAKELLQRDTAGQLSILRGLEEFREHLGGALTITLLKRIGQSVEVHQMDPGLIGKAIDELQRR